MRVRVRVVDLGSVVNQRCPERTIADDQETSEGPGSADECARFEEEAWGLLGRKARQERYHGTRARAFGILEA